MTGEQVGKFYAYLYSIRALMPVMDKSKCASIINVSSSAALCSLAGTSVYSANKSALKDFTEAVREEYRDDFYIGLACPGFTKTNIFSDQEKSSKKIDKVIDFVSTDCNKMVDKIIRGIWKKKDNMVFGADAHTIDIGYEVFNTFCCNVASKIIKVADITMFKSVFNKTAG